MLVANLKIECETVVRDVLTRVFERAVRVKLERQRSDQAPFELDLARTYLQRADLEGLDFRQVALDVAFQPARRESDRRAGVPLLGFDVRLEGAKSARANLQEARLNCTHCREAQFHGANQVSATFKEADLRQAQFHQARLQSAHFEQADLTNTEFQEADLNDAFCQEVTLNESSLRSETRALNWCNVHFDRGVMEQLQTIAADDARPTTGGPDAG